MKLTLIFFYCMLMTFTALSQKENNIWCFGFNAGLDFNYSPPKPFKSEIYTDEGSASISDRDGNILMYTDGMTIWDRSHSVMPNGTNLIGEVSSTQVALILPLPNSSSLYYVFTTQAVGSLGKFAYSIVDLSLNNGLGDLIPGSKNIVITENTSEQLNSVLHSNGRDIWIITHKLNSNQFLVYLLTENGLELNPVISPIGTVYGGGGAGPIKAAHNGTKIAASIISGSVAELFSFNAATGVVFDLVDLNSILGLDIYFYGMEFSPNGRFLYLCSHNPSLIFQLDLEFMTFYLLKSGSFGEFSGIQLGPDGKIYNPNYGHGFVDVIHHPDKLGQSCEYEEDFIQLVSGTSCSEGLNNYAPYSLFLDTSFTPNLESYISRCEDSLVSLQVNFPDNCFPISFLWNNGSTNSTIVAEESGVYWVEVTSTCGTYRDSTIVNLEPCESLIYYSLDACESYMSNGSHMAYNEFVPTYPTILPCAGIEASIANRLNPQENKHSCTPGVNGSVAMCISSYPSCMYVPSNEAALVFDVEVIPHVDSVVRITGLEFFQRAPEIYNWINGPSGLNNYPKKVALRILKNGVEIYRNLGIQTSIQWRLEFISFIEDEKFIVSDSSVFHFEFLPYCLVGNDASVAAWDIDEIKVIGGCKQKSETQPIIVGSVYTVTGKPIVGATIEYSRYPTFSIKEFVLTNDRGEYIIILQEEFDSLYLRVEKQDAFLNGVSTLDLVKLQKHLLGISSFTFLTQFIAADIDMNKQLNTSDLINLKKRLLGYPQPLEDKISWRFAPLPINLVSDDFDEFNEIVRFKNLGSNIKIDFLGIKIGDLNQTIN